MLKKATVLIIFEDVDGVRVWSGKTGKNLSLSEWTDLVERLARQNFLTERGGKSGEDEGEREVKEDA